MMPAYRKVVAGLLSAAVALAAQSLAMADRFESNLTVGKTNDQVSVVLQVDQPRSDNVYVAMQGMDGSFWFYTPTTGFQPYVPGSASPAAFQAPAAGSYALLDFTVPALLAGSVNLYTLRAPAGTDVVQAFNSGSVDLSTFSEMRLSFNQPASTTHDYDGNGFPDDDANHNGISDGNEWAPSPTPAVPTPTPTPATTPNAQTALGSSLYSANCASCHGSGSNALIGVTAATIRNAITANRGGMGRFSTMTDSDLQAIAAYLAPAAAQPGGGTGGTSGSTGGTSPSSIGCATGTHLEYGVCQPDDNGGNAPTPTPTANPSASSAYGASLFNANCAGCHGSAAGLAGVSAAMIRNAISANRGGMGRLYNLTDADIAEISAYLSSGTPQSGGGTSSGVCPAGSHLEHGVCEGEGHEGSEGGGGHDD